MAHQSCTTRRRLRSTCLSVCYYHGEGVEIDYWQAYFWLNKAAEKGNIHSKKDIAELKELSKLNVANLEVHIMS